MSPFTRVLSNGFHTKLEGPHRFGRAVGSGLVEPTTKPKNNQRVRMRMAGNHQVFWGSDSYFEANPTLRPRINLAITPWGSTRSTVRQDAWPQEPVEGPKFVTCWCLFTLVSSPAKCLEVPKRDRSPVAFSGPWAAFEALFLGPLNSLKQEPQTPFQGTIKFSDMNAGFPSPGSVCHLKGLFIGVSSPKQ